MIAIVIPYYKKIFFRKTLESLANQTDKRFKVYIGDDASPEDPKDLIVEYGDKFDLIYIRFQNNLGGTSLVGQWNRCIELSDGEEWIMILGDDDYFSPNVVESFYNHSLEFLEKTNVVRFSMQTVYPNQDTVLEIQTNPKWETGADSYYRRITGKSSSTLSEYAFTREIYEKIGFYNYTLGWKADTRAWIEFSENKPIYSINDAVVSVIRSTQSISGSDRFAGEKGEVNLSFYKYLITQKLHIFNNNQAIRVLHKYENELRHREKIKLNTYLFLFPYYFRNYEAQSFKRFIKKMTKTFLRIQ